MPTTRTTRSRYYNNRGPRGRYAKSYTNEEQYTEKNMPPAPPSSPLDAVKPPAPLKPPACSFQNALLEQEAIYASNEIKNTEEIQRQEIENRSPLHIQEKLVRAQLGKEEIQGRRSVFKQVLFEHAALKAESQQPVTSPNKRSASPTESFFKIPKPETPASSQSAQALSREELPVGAASWWCSVM